MPGRDGGRGGIALTQTYGIALDADHVYFSRMDFPKTVRVKSAYTPLGAPVVGIIALLRQHLPAHGADAPRKL
jgi:hypothetical protein